MPSIREQKLLYHLTSLQNLGSILDNGLQPRSALNGFHDVADAEILAGRADHGLDRHVPFHWFSCNPFDGRVQTDRPDEDFVLLTVRRTLAMARSWKVLPMHPLARQDFRFFDYQEGFDVIDWELMDRRDYSDADCKSVCMAECLAPEPVSVADFFKIYVPTERVQQVVLGELARRLEFLDAIDWPLLQQRNFQRDPDDPEKVERYQAEALIHEHMPIEALQGAVCYTPQVKLELQQQAAGLGVELDIYCMPAWYF